MIIAHIAGYLPDKTGADGKEVWPIGDEKAWKSGLRSVERGWRVCAHVVRVSD